MTYNILYSIMEVSGSFGMKMEEANMRDYRQLELRD